MDSKAAFAPAFAPDTPSLDSSSSGSVPPSSNHSVIDTIDDNSIKNDSLELGSDDTVSNSDVGFAAVNDSPSVGPLEGEKPAPEVSGNGGSLVLDDNDDDDDQFVVGGEKVKSLEEGESEEGVGDKGFVQKDEIVGSNAVEKEGLVETASEKKVEVEGGEPGEGVSESGVLRGENGKVESGSLEPEGGTGDGDAVVEAVNVDLLRSGVAVIGDTEEIKYSKIKGMESPSAVPVDNEFDKISDDVEEPIVLDSGKKIEHEVSKPEKNGGDADISNVGKSRTSLPVVEDDTDVKEDANLVDSGNASVAYGEEKQETEEPDADTETEQIKPLMAAEVQDVAANDKVDEADNVAVISRGLEDVTSGNSVVPESTELGAPTEGEENLEAHDEEKHHTDEEGENDGSDEENESMVFGSSEAAKQFLEELERASAVGSRSGGESSQDHSQRIDGQIATDSDEEVDTDEEGEGKELFDSSALAALLKAATGVDTDSGTVTVTSQDGSRLFSVERPAGLGSSLRAVRPAARPARPNLFSPSGVTTGGDSDNNLSDEEKKKLEKLQQLRVNFLRLVHRLGHSPEESIASQVLYRLALVAGRQTNQLFSLDTAKRTALQLEAEGKDDLNFSLNILVLGKTGVGKSATINSIFGEEKSVIHAFQPATSAVREITGTVDGVQIRVIDTPGLKSSGSEQGANRKILSSVKSFMKKCPPDIVLYVDRLDTQTRDLNDLPLLRSITSALGSSIWRSAIVTLTHAASAPPDGPSGSPLSYEVFVAQRSHVVQQSIGQAVGDLRLMNPSLMNPVSLVENHPSCRKNRDGEKVLPNGQTWKPQLLLLCYSMKILSEASSQSKPQDPFDHKKLFGFRVRSPPLPYLLSWLLQSRAHPKLSSDQGVENVDSDVDLADLSDSDDEEEEDEYDQLPPFKPLRKAQLARLTREQKKAYFEEYDYRVKLLQKKQWREELRRMREMKKKGKPAEDEYNYPGEDGDPENGAPAAVPVPLPDMALPPSFDGDNPAYRYRFLEPTSQFLARPVLDTHGWDHDCGYDGVNIEQSLALASRFPATVAVQLTKDKKEFNIHLDSSISAKHGENASSMAGFDIQNVGKQLAYVVRGETKFKNLKNNKTAAGMSVTFLGENVATGFKLEDQIALGKRLVLVGSTGTVRSQSDSAYGANLEVRLREADYPIGQDQSSLGLSLVKWRNELALGANLQSQFSMGRSYKIAVRAGLNNKMSGQITVRTSSSEQLQLALVGLLPIATTIYKILRPGVSDSYSMY